MAKTLRTEESIMIARPVADVFEYMSNPDNAPAWNGNVVDYNLESGKPDEVGSVTSFTAKVAGFKLEATEELTDYQANKRLGFRSVKSKVGYDRELDFAVDGEHTRVTWVSEAEAGTGVFKFADPIVQKLHAHDVRSSLEKAKTILEA
ncbi:SRPBCC family protein [Rhodococcus sp. Q]|uniref:SRPBCC family protein n=1 Tax=Rhodococcus sp. Q TaxID=2502252 RepID=UPI0010F536D1|nr:SRPBCC family protein [Rhodococcus sp. Q]